MKSLGRLCVSLSLLLILNVARAEEEQEKDETQPKPKLQIGIRKKIEKHNCPLRTRQGDIVDVHFYGKLEDGTEFDNSMKRDEPLKFMFGGGTVIKGWEHGLLGMCVGEKRRLVVPPIVAYGEAGTKGVPSGATVIYEVELLKNYADRPPENKRRKPKGGQKQ